MEYFEVIAILNKKEDENLFTKELCKMLEEKGAKEITQEIWGDRLLAYPVKKQKRGNFIVVNFGRETLDFDVIKEVENYMNSNENVLKHIVVKK